MTHKAKQTRVRKPPVKPRRKQPGLLKAEYDQYISSIEWAAKRAEYWEKRGRSCKAKGCKATENLHVHHHTYIRLKHEQMSDLVGLCSSHHLQVHALHRQSRGKLSLTRATEKVTKLRLAPRKPKPVIEGQIVIVRESARQLRQQRAAK